MSVNTSTTSGSGREGGGARTGASLLAPSKFSSNFLSGNSSAASATSTAATTTTNATAGSGSLAPRSAPEPARSSSSFPGFKASKLSGITQTLFSSETKKEPAAAPAPAASTNLWSAKDEAKAAAPAEEKPKPVSLPLEEKAEIETDKENTKISPVKRSPEKAEEEEEPATSAKRVRLETAPPPASAPSPAKTGPEPEVKPSQSLSPRSSDAPNFIFGQNLAERADNFATGFVFGQNLTERAANFSPEPAADETEPDKPKPSTFTPPPVAAPVSDPKSPPKSLTESAAAYYESHAAPKRKYDEVVVVTGEEGEVNVVQMSAKLHWFDKATSNWHERGRGTLRLNDIAEPNSKTSSPPAFASRLVMRTAGSLRVVLNTKLYRGMPVECPTEKNLRLTGMDDAGVLRVFLVTGTAKDISNMFAALQFRLKAIEQQEKACQNEGQGSESDSEEEDDGDAGGDEIKVPRLK